MRIVGGSLRGRRLAVPPGATVRPTASRAREALFNLLAHNAYGPAPPPAGATVVDAFAGSGALGFEALSRGARRVIFLERDPAARRCLAATSRALGADQSVTILARDATRPGRAPAPADLVLLDPPYRAGLATPALVALIAGGWLAAGAVAVVECAADETVTPPPGLVVLDKRRYGAARLVILGRDAGAAVGER